MRSFKVSHKSPNIIQHEPHYRLLTFLIGLSPPPSSAGSTVLNPLVLLLSLLLGLLTGLCSSITSTISSSGGGAGRLVLRSSTIIVSLLVRLGLLTLTTSAVSVRETREWAGERDLDRECRRMISSSTIV
jgi:hypothetical protein